MTQLLQLLVFVGAIVGLIAFGFYRDKREHEDARQRSIYFPNHKNDERGHEGAAMSRVR
jgi:hypothetical protein